MGLIVLGLCIAQSASAARIEGTFLGTFSGNDSEAAIATVLAIAPGDVTLLAKVDILATPAPDPSANDGLALSNLTLNGDNEAVSGDWDYAGLGTVSILVVKAGNSYAAYQYTAALTGGMLNLGLWDTSDLANKGVSHVSAYAVVPEPTTALLLGLALAGLAARARA